MSINLHNPLWKEFLKYLGWILLFAVLWFKGCSVAEKSSATAKVIVPEVKGNFEAKKPVHEPIVNPSNSRELEKGKITFIENPIDEKLIAENEKLKSDYAKANDSIKQLSFNKAIQLNKFSTKFEDDNLLLNINGVVQGEVKEITPNYTIKEKKIEVPVKAKETVFRLLGGLEVGNNTKLDNFKVKANLMFQNRKGNIISGSFDTNQTIWVGYTISIFDVKR
jgi:hypothetical protein